jgi:hypothetical protein
MLVWTVKLPIEVAQNHRTEKMLLPEIQVQEIMEKAKTDFPSFSEWEYNNELDKDYWGFTIWGQYALDLEDDRSVIYFVTFTLDGGRWSGNLTAGQHAYMWSSTKEGDADLLWTHHCDSFEVAVTQLKKKILTLFQAFSVV